MHFGFRTTVLAVLMFMSGCDLLNRNSLPPSVPAPAGRFELSLDSKVALLNEIYQVVLRTDKISKEMFQGQIGALDQGASLIGIYNGLIHSAVYRQFEQKSLPVQVDRLEIFARELFLLVEVGIEISRQAAAPLSQMMSYEELERPMSTRASENLRTLVDIRSAFQNKNFFILKRVWSDAVQTRFEQLDTSQKNVWFSKFAVRMAAVPLAFGLDARKNANEKFHLDWANRAPSDLLYWEVFNRIHRVLNP